MSDNMGATFALERILSGASGFHFTACLIHITCNNICGITAVISGARNKFGIKMRKVSSVKAVENSACLSLQHRDVLRPLQQPIHKALERGAVSIGREVPASASIRSRSHDCSLSPFGAGLRFRGMVGFFCFLEAELAASFRLCL